MQPAICVEDLSKQFRLGGHWNGGYRTLREALVQAARAPWARLRGLARRRPDRPPPGEAAGILWALKDVSLEVEQGEVMGIVGRNGAGKSTLLKVLSRITEPTEGRVRLRGRVGSLLEVGTGFHPELTGRENIYLNGAILGMSRQEINRKFDEIVAFAEVERFLDLPVKRYSSGMGVRLAFAVAANLDPEILVVDEVLAVGDLAFQQRCLGRMGDIARSGRTVLLVSHNMASILNLCKKVVVLERGRVSYVGECAKGVAWYVDSGRTCGGEADLSARPNRRLGGNPFLALVRVRDGEGKVTDRLTCGGPMTIDVLVDTCGQPTDYNVQVGVEDHLGVRLFTVATNFSAVGPLALRGRQLVRCEVGPLPLAPGRYALSLYLGPSYKPAVDAVEQALWFEVVEADFYGNGHLPHPSEGRFLVRSVWRAVEGQE
jgi:lipopolysaccharide transport system ATP-binding protein